MIHGLRYNSTLNNLSAFLQMYHFIPDNHDLEDFAKWNGFEGIDSDLFYENYYGLSEDTYDDYEIELQELGYDP